MQEELEGRLLYLAYQWDWTEAARTLGVPLAALALALWLGVRWGRALSTETQERREAKCARKREETSALIKQHLFDLIAGVRKLPLLEAEAKPLGQ